MMGRVMSLLAVVLLGGNVAGGPMTAVTATLAGPHAPFVLGAGTAWATALITAHRQPRPRRPDRTGPTRETSTSGIPKATGRPSLSRFA